MTDTIVILGDGPPPTARPNRSRITQRAGHCSQCFGVQEGRQGQAAEVNMPALGKLLCLLSDLNQHKT